MGEKRSGSFLIRRSTLSLSSVLACERKGVEDAGEGPIDEDGQVLKLEDDGLSK